MQLLRKLAFPVSLVYAVVVHVRNFLFDIGFFKVKSFDTFTICVGNLSVGGTGKTPMIEYLIKLLEKGNKVAILSRGYKRKSKGYVLASTNSNVEDLGDEPYQIHTKFENVHVAVDADRCNGIEHLEQSVEPNVILLDDAFQHRKVKPDYSILLSAYHNLYINDWYLPTGDLRDGKREAKRADVIVVTKCPKSLGQKERNSIVEALGLKYGQLVLFSSIGYDKMLKGAESVTLDDIKNRKITLVTGIANPKPLVEYLEKKGLQFEHLEFNDHHFFSPSEISSFSTKEIVLTTEKDYVRLKNKVNNLYYISIRHEFLFGGDIELSNSIERSMN